MPQPAPAADRPPVHGRSRIRAAAALFGLALLVAATVATARFRHVDHGLLLDGAVAAGSEWRSGGDRDEVSVEQGKLTLTANGGEGWLAIDLLLKDVEIGHAALRVETEVSVVSPSSPSSRRDDAALMLWFTDASGDDFGGTTLTRLDAYAEDASVTRVVAVPESAELATVALLGRRSDGTFELAIPTIRLLENTSVARLASLAVIAMWALVALAFAIWVVRTGGVGVAIPLALLAASILVGVLTPERLGANVADLLNRLVAAVGLSDQALTPRLVFKSGHLALFFALAVVLFAAADRLGVTRFVLACGLLLSAAGTEALQMHLDDRTAGWFDFSVDAVGILGALMVVTLWQSFMHRPRTDSSGTPSDHHDPIESR